MRSRKLALLLSFIYCGLGQIYKGQILKGVNFAIIYTALIATVFIPVRMVHIAGISVLPFMWIVGMVDAYTAEPVFINRGKRILALLPGVILSAIVLYVQISPGSGKVVYVSINTGDNSNPGTKEAPMKNIDKAIAAAGKGGVLLVAEGAYSGTLQIGHLATNKPVEIYGGYSTDFSERDVVKHSTLFQPGGKIGADSVRALLTLSNEVDGVVVDGFIFDMGMRNVYSPNEGKPAGVETGMLLLPDEAGGAMKTVAKQCIYIAANNTGGNITISNNVFLNGAWFAIHGTIPTGKLTITNNVFVSNRMAAIEVWGSAIREMPSAEIAYNTILFSWGRLKDSKEMGYGIRMVDKMKYNIHHNIIGGSVLSGVHNSSSSNDKWTKLDNNIFFLNKQSDLEYNRGGAYLKFPASEFGNLEFSSSRGNRSEIASDYPIDRAYLEGFLNALYGTSESNSVTMFCNRYPWKKALELFGAVSDAGAQVDRWPLVEPRVRRNIIPSF